MMTRFHFLKYYLNEKYLRHFKNRTHFEKWQQKQLKKALTRATQIFPFYQTTNNSYDRFPVIDKQIFMDNFAELNSAKSNIHERLKWISKLLAKVLPGPLSKKRRIAFIHRGDNPLYGINSGGLHVKFFNLEEAFSLLICSLIDFNPQIIVAPAQVLSLLAKYLRNHPLRRKVEYIISVTNVPTEFDRQYIEKTFNKRIHEIYLANEGFLATRCYKGTLHLNEDLLYFERQYLDKEKKYFVPVITNLFRETQAIIRYRLEGLILLKKQHCDCNSVFQALEKITNRL